MERVIKNGEEREGPPGDKSCTRAADCGDSWCKLCDADSSIRGRSSDKSRVSIGSMAIGARTLPFMQLLKKGLLNTGDTTDDVETTLRGGDRMTDATREQDEVERDRRGSAGNPRVPIRPPRLVTCRLILDFTATEAQSRRYYDCTDISHSTGLSIKTRLKICPLSSKVPSAMKCSDQHGGTPRRACDNVFRPRIDPRVRIKLENLVWKSRAFDGLMSPGCWSLLTDFGIDLKPRAGGREGEIRRREDEGIMDLLRTLFWTDTANPSQVGRSTMQPMQRNTAIGSSPPPTTPLPRTMEPTMNVFQQLDS
ncbi:uncharacterized protein BO87DRAFT_397310 [Aspergillus neoniger CBS 115656]|uniref:Uncharacterized protein n=1 Tax=Aspergillus neoniger (strain CBS 115656) TaxID=1448310 RepID=A0A318YN24_ASPNB|nr:hypothetical protein BO87DRAFT_397310 [Aspergillus neoniger CBS 115656]PYH34133.1 hypothetical protein BO87DRAFT_397310 [Aspergillus neoniger CBS 115656]